MMNLSSREKKILSLLNSTHGIVTGKELSTKLGVSERTIRSDISDINSLLEPFEIKIDAVHRKGYRLSVKDRVALVGIFSQEQSYITKEDRISTLLLKLLRSDGWFDLGNLEDEMFVSSTTLEKDIKALKRQISEQHPHIQILRKDNKIRLEDDERKKRDLLTRFYAKNWDYDSRDGIVFKEMEFGNSLLVEVQQLVKQRLNESGIHLDDFAFIYLTIAISVMFFRVKSGYTVNTDLLSSSKDSPAGDIISDDYKIDEDIRCILDQLADIGDTAFDIGEYIYISQIKNQLEFLCLKTYSKNYVLTNTNVVCHMIVNDLLQNIFDEFGMDFTEDDKLFIDLTRHVQALISGIVAPHTQNHLFGYELRKKHAILADIASFMRKKLSEKCEIELGIEEEDYLLPFLVLSEEALYRRRRGQGIQVAVISHYNESITHYLMEILKQKYGGYFKFYGPYAQYNKELIESDVKFILTTVKIDGFSDLFHVPSLVISPLLTEIDEGNINRYLEDFKKGYLIK